MEKQTGSLADRQITERLAKQAEADRGVAQRLADAKETYKATGDPRASIRRYCAGNRWLEENARAVGDW